MPKLESCTDQTIKTATGVIEFDSNIYRLVHTDMLDLICICQSAQVKGPRHTILALDTTLEVVLALLWSPQLHVKKTSCQ